MGYLTTKTTSNKMIVSYYMNKDSYREELWRNYLNKYLMEKK